MSTLPVDSASVDLVLSNFGLVFAEAPALALAEVGRALRPTGRLLMTAWLPGDPVNAALGAMGRVVARASGRSASPPRFAWHDVEAVRDVAAHAGLVLAAAAAHEIESRAGSSEQFVDQRFEHPMGVAVRPALQAAGREAEARAAFHAVIDDANESATAFLVRRPYVVYSFTRS